LALYAVVIELHPSPNNPLGAKGAGEGGIVVIANAVADALKSFGAEVGELPLTPRGSGR
jgi:carbon-monoxide dehydrogenase large subunit